MDFCFLSLFAPPGVGFSVFLCQRSYFLLPLPIFLLIFFLYALPICSGDHGVLGDQHLDQHEMLLRGIGPDLTAMPVAEVQPATILAVRAREVLPLFRWSKLRLVQVVIHEHPLALVEPCVGLSDQLALGISIVPHAGLFTGHAVE